MTLFLHIGMGKTGTTTIQHFLMNHRPALRERGYLFPTTFGLHNHEALSVYACGFSPGFARHKRPDLNTHDAFGAWEEQMKAGFRDEIAAASPDHIVLSNEHMFEHVRSRGQLRRLKRLIAIAGDDVKVIVYLRRPDSFMASFYAESVRMGYDGHIDELMDHPRARRLLSYNQAVGGWGDLFGDANVSIRLFEPGRLVNGDALSDFGEMIGLDLPSLAGDKPPERRRDALDAYRTNFLRQFNAEVGSILKSGRLTNVNIRDFKTVNVRGPLVKILSDGEARDRVRLTRKQATKIIKRYQNDNEKLFARFGIEGFDTTEPPDAPPLEEFVDPNLSFELFARIWTSQMDRANQRPAVRAAPPQAAARPAAAQIARPHGDIAPATPATVLMVREAAPSYSDSRGGGMAVTSKRPQIEFRPQDRRKPESTWLQAHRRNVTSHGGEDGIVEKIFEIIGTENKICVEFGAADGKHFSNSYNLITNVGWSGILIEPFHQFAKLQELYRNNPKVELINEIVGFDKANSLDAHLGSRKMTVPRDIDFMSIDIDGNDVHVWRDMREFRPRVICIEFNHFVPLDVYMVQPKDLDLCIGSSLLATAEIGKELGYELVATTAANAIFVDAPLFPKFNIADNSVEAMHFLGQNESKIVPSYDGTLFLAGLSRNPWKGYIIDEERIQVLPSNMRKWKFDGRPWPSTKL